jgi:hypothetical protein
MMNLEELMKKTVPIYQLKVTLMGSKPPIWRRILVRSDVKLDILHRILQETMGWTESHLHQFTVHGASYGPHYQELGGDLEYENEARYRLSQLLTTEKDSLIYEYDFGDGWEHKVTLEKILPHDDSVQIPSCIKGKRNCPPEDCGGVWGYESLIEIMGDPKHPEHEEMLEWLGGELDPEYFDLDAINQALSAFRPRRTSSKTANH